MGNEKETKGERKNQLFCSIGRIFFVFVKPKCSRKLFLKIKKIEIENMKKLKTNKEEERKKPIFFC